MIAKAGWTVEPALDSGAEGERIAEAIEAAMYDLRRPWHRVVRAAAMYKLQGYSWLEWITKKRADGTIGFFDCEPRSQSTVERWDVDEAGDVLGVWQRSPQTAREHYIPRAKSIYVVDDTVSFSPEGAGILRHVAPVAARLQAYERLEGIGFETDLRGIPVGRIPYSVLDEMVESGVIDRSKADEIASTLEQFVTDHIRSKATGVVLDSMVYRDLGESQAPSGQRLWDLDLLRGGSSSQDAVANAINRLVRGIARLLSSEGLLLGETGAGSLAMSLDKSASFASLVDGVNVEIAEVLEQDFVGPLMRMNGWNEELTPTLRTSKLQHRDVTVIAETLERISRSGAPLGPEDTDTVNVVRDLLGLPHVEKIEVAMDEGLRGSARPDDEDDIEDGSEQGSGAVAEADDEEQEDQEEEKR